MIKKMKKIEKRSVIGIFVAIIILQFCFSPQFRNIYSFPPHMRIFAGETALLTVSFPLTVTINHNEEKSVKLKSDLDFSMVKPVFLESIKTGRATIEFKLLGIIPMRAVDVDVLPPTNLYPGGQSIGVVLHSQGVIVVGNSPVQTADGQFVTPAKDAGIVIGDVILSVNDVPIQSDAQLAEIIDSCGQKQQPVTALLKRGNQNINISVLPSMCTDTQRYRIGLFVRDSAAGVGTLTFYDDKSHIYGALGHVITDSDTNLPIDCQQGKIVLATVSGIQQGKRGQPGEKIGIFIEEDQLLGDIRSNTPFGIYGKLATSITNNLYPDSIPIASMTQIQTGDAEMLTVIDGQQIEKFSIDIQKINLQDAPEGKGLVIKITDPRLLEKTGGIVQGMSGSPIIQNGKLVGAVTHVFVHDPTKGYGCFVDWMLMESGLIPKQTKQTARKLFTFSGSLFF